jgi:hypothetical protein
MIKVDQARSAAQARGLRVLSLRVSADSEFDAAFTQIAAQRAGALFVGDSPFFTSRRDRIVGLAAQHRVLAGYEWREFALAGGLMRATVVHAAIMKLEVKICHTPALHNRYSRYSRLAQSTPALSASSARSLCSVLSQKAARSWRSVLSTKQTAHLLVRAKNINA